MYAALKYFANSTFPKLTLAADNAEVPSIGKCASAAVVKTEMNNAGYLPLVAYDRIVLKFHGDVLTRRGGA